MNKYEIMNPSDKAYIEAESHEVAVIATILLGKGMYGLGEIDGDFSMPPIFIKDWIVDTFGKSGEELFDEVDRQAVICALRSVRLSGERTSITDFSKYAHALATQMEKEANTTT